MSRSLKFIVPSLLVSFFAILAIHFYVFFFTPPAEFIGAKRILIPSGSGVLEVAKTLEKEGLIRDYKKFIRITKYKNAEAKIKPGTYLFEKPAPPLEILKKLIKGDAEKLLITIPEGYNIYEIAAVLEKNAIIDKKTFLEAASDKTLLKALGIDGSSAEGFLFPDTYNFSVGMKASEIITVMNNRFKSIYTDEMRQRAAKLGFNTHEFITFASIVEKETGNPSERELVASVFLNRLRKKMRLDSDPTVIYGKWKSFDGNLRKTDLTEKNPYNTYSFTGLPKGPVSNPGKASIMAVLNASNTDYLYFVSKNDGSHYFSKTISEHGLAVKKYQKNGG